MCAVCHCSLSAFPFPLPSFRGAERGARLASTDPLSAELYPAGGEVRPPSFAEARRPYFRGVFAIHTVLQGCKNGISYLTLY